MKTSDFDFELPSERIAQYPENQRDKSRLMVLHRNSGQIEHRRFGDLPRFLNHGDVLVLNDSRVIRARLHGKDSEGQRQFEILLLEENRANDWWAMMRPGKFAGIGKIIQLLDVSGSLTEIKARVTAVNPEGHRRLEFSGPINIFSILDDLGEVPLPPYITRERNPYSDQDAQRYQTVFAKMNGSVAAPTAGLHFTHELLDQIRAKGIKICFVTLHVGPGTFAPVKSEMIEEHRMHQERFEISDETKQAIVECKIAGGRVIAVGTTSMRVLESIAASGMDTSGSDSKQTQGSLSPELKSRGSLSGKTGIFIYPPYHFRLVDALLTNFHLPRSTLLMLVSAFAAPDEMTGRATILKAYSEAIREQYRFFSYGDAMLLL